MGDEYHIIGDAAYQISKNVMTPGKNNENLTIVQQRFKEKFSATRVKIENSFFSLKAWLHQLIYLELSTAVRMSNLILSCC